MKHTLFLATLLAFAHFTQAQSFANRNLSNLQSPTAVNQDLLPNSTNTRDLGSSVNNWKNFYLGGSIFKGNLSFLSNQGTQNTFLGITAGNAITTGSKNTAHGYQALQQNTTGSENTATGTEALRDNTTGVDNTAYGSLAMQLNTTGSWNAAFGKHALMNNTGIGGNTAIGYEALKNNTTGFVNTACGNEALINNTTGDQNTAVGHDALFGNTTGSDNTAAGIFSLSDNNGNANTAIGIFAGGNFTTTNCTFLGSETRVVDAAGYDNSTAIGYQAAFVASNQVRIGNSSVTSIGGFADWTNFSDGRYKKNIQEDVPGLAFITQLKAITYTLDIEGLEKTMRANTLQMKTSAGKPVVQPKLSQQDEAAKKARAKEIHTGFSAQEVEAVAKKLNYDFNGVDAPKNDKDFYGLRYAEFVVPLVKAVQELDEKNKELSKKNEELEERIKKLEALLSTGNNNRNNLSLASSACLEPNAPNPFNSTTIIRYYVPEESVSSQIVITDMKGQVVKTVAVSSKGASQVSISRGTLVAGSYFYSLWVNGKQVDSKKMILTR